MYKGFLGMVLCRELQYLHAWKKNIHTHRKTRLIEPVDDHNLIKNKKPVLTE